jgi:PleD family two-component response regulator
LLMRTRLTALGYDTVEVTDGDECVAAAAATPIDLIVLDISMRRMDGFEACSQLRRNPRTRHIPVVILTALRTDVDDRVRGLRVGADEYLPKDVAPEELAARIEGVLRRAVGATEISPLTRLPGNAVITDEIDGRIRNRKSFAVAWADVDNFKAFNDRYGFSRGDKMILEAAAILRESVDSFGAGEDFLGHVGGDDFVVVSSIERSTRIAENAVQLVDKRFPLLYDLDDRARGYIRSVDRNGNGITFPLAGMSIAIVLSRAQRFQNVLQLAEVASETKKQAKSRQGSGIVVDRRVQ